MGDRQRLHLFDPAAARTDRNWEIGLHRRVGRGMEIGYRVDARRGPGPGHGSGPDADRVALPAWRDPAEIHCDEANLASAAIPRKLGYRLDRIDRHQPEASRGSGAAGWCGVTEAR